MVFRAILHTVDRVVAQKLLSPDVARVITSLWGSTLLSWGKRPAVQRFRDEHGCDPPWFLVISPGHACNLRCPGCYADSGPGQGRLRWSILDRVMTEAKQLWGVPLFVLSGGEPTIHADLPELAGAFKEAGFLVKLDTNGSNPAMLKRLLEGNLVDLAALDVKAPPDKRYSAAAGSEVDTKAIRESAELLLSRPEKAEFRTTVVPGIHTPEMIEEMAGLISTATVYYIQNFEPHNTLKREMEDLEPFSREELAAFAAAAAKHVGCAAVRGTDIAEGEKCPMLREMGMV